MTLTWSFSRIGGKGRLQIVAPDNSEALVLDFCVLVSLNSSRFRPWSGECRLGKKHKNWSEAAGPQCRGDGPIPAHRVGDPPQIEKKVPVSL